MVKQHNRSVLLAKEFLGDATFTAQGCGGGMVVSGGSSEQSETRGDRRTASLESTQLPCVSFLARSRPCSSLVRGRLRHRLISVVRRLPRDPVWFGNVRPGLFFCVALWRCSPPPPRLVIYFFSVFLSFLLGFLRLFLSAFVLRGVGRFRGVVISRGGVVRRRRLRLHQLSTSTLLPYVCDALLLWRRWSK